MTGFHPDEIVELGAAIAQELKRLDDDYIRKVDAVQYVLENNYDDVKEQVFEQEGEAMRE